MYLFKVPGKLSFWTLCSSQANLFQAKNGTKKLWAFYLEIMFGIYVVYAVDLFSL
jgi:hypothetical protein